MYITMMTLLMLNITLFGGWILLEMMTPDV